MGDSTRSTRVVPRELTIYLLVVAALWFFSLLDALHPFGGNRAGGGFSDLFLIHPGFDTLCYIDRFQFIHHAQFFTGPGFPWSYPAPCAFLYGLIYSFHGSAHHLGARSLAAYGVMVVLLVVIAGRMFWSALLQRGLEKRSAGLFVVASAVFSWPIYFAIERGNLEALLWFGLAFAMFAYVRRRWMLAAVVLGVVAAFKLYPVLCFALFLQPRRYREIAMGSLAAVTTTVLGLFYIGPNLSFAASETVRGIQGFVKLYSGIYDPVVIGYDHSAFSLIKVLSVNHPMFIPIYLPRYTAIAGILALALFLGRSFRMPRLNQMLTLMVLIVLLPSTSFDYTLQSLYIPWAWLCLTVVRANRAQQQIAGAITAMVCFALLLGPETFLHVHGVLAAGQLKAVILIVLLGLSLIFRFEEENWHFEPVKGPEVG